MDILEEEYEIILAKVKEGAALLDEHFQDWHSGVDLERLDLAHPYNCILGQLYGSYGTGLDILTRLEGKYVSPAGHGFGRIADWPYEPLTQVWRDCLEAS